MNPAFQEKRTTLAIHEKQETKKEIVGAYSESVKQITQLVSDLQQFIEDSVTANIQVWSNTDQEKLYKKARKKFTVPTIRWNDPDLLDFTVTAKPVEELQSVCRQTADTLVKGVWKAFYEVLDEMVESNYFGLCEWVSDDACMYYFYRTVISQKKTAVRNTKRTLSRFENSLPRKVHFYEEHKKEDVFEKTHVYERHEHHLYEARRQPIWEPIKMPLFIEELLKRVPKCLHDKVEIVEGEMCKEVIKSTLIEKATILKTCALEETFLGYGVLYSPAVVIGKYVFSGWSGRDLPS